MLRFILIVACVLAARPVWAHAVLLETQPADGASLADAPSEVLLRFNEPVAPVTIRVLDAAGVNRAVTAPSAQDNAIRLDLPALPRGGYIVSWRVVSADSHPIGGGFVFTVGETSPPRAFTPDDAEREAGWTLAVILNRFVLYASLIFVAGGALFAALVLRPLRIDIASFAHWRLCAATAAMGAALLAIGLKGGQLGALPATALVDPATWRLGLSTSTAWSAAIIVPGLLLLVSAGRLGRARPWGEAIGGAVALIGLSATGHAATGPAWAQALAALHALLAGFWLGAFWPLLRLLPAHPAAALAAARRFSHLAVPAVLALVASGVGLALQRLPALENLTASNYGRFLLCKLLFVIPLLIVAAANRWQATPALAAGQRGASSGLGRNIRLEIVLGCLVLILTAVIAHTPPPGAAVHDHGERRENGHTAWIGQRDRALLLDLVPAAFGANAVTARLLGASGETLVPLEATVSFARPAEGVEAITRPLSRGADGAFRLERIDLPQAGLWTVRVEVLISDFEKAVFVAEIPISAPPTQ